MNNLGFLNNLYSFLTTYNLPTPPAATPGANPPPAVVTQKPSDNNSTAAAAPVTLKVAELVQNKQAADKTSSGDGWIAIDVQQDNNSITTRTVSSTDSAQNFTVAAANPHPPVTQKVAALVQNKNSDDKTSSEGNLVVIDIQKDTKTQSSVASSASTVKDKKNKKVAWSEDITIILPQENEEEDKKTAALSVTKAVMAPAYSKLNHSATETHIPQAEVIKILDNKPWNEITIQLPDFPLETLPYEAVSYTLKKDSKTFDLRIFNFTKDDYSFSDNRELLLDNRCINNALVYTPDSCTTLIWKNKTGDVYIYGLDDGTRPILRLLSLNPRTKNIEAVDFKVNPLVPEAPKLLSNVRRKQIQSCGRCCGDNVRPGGTS